MKYAIDDLGAVISENCLGHQLMADEPARWVIGNGYQSLNIKEKAKDFADYLPLEI